MYKCKYCGREFEKAASMAAHTGRCKNNPKREDNIRKTNAYLNNANKQRLKNLAEDPKRQKKEYTFTCKKCGKEYTLLLNEIEYNKGNYRKYCSKKCANIYTGALRKGTASDIKLLKPCACCGELTECSINTRNNNIRCDKCKNNQYIYTDADNIKICPICGKSYRYILGISTRMVCSQDCRNEYINNLRKYLSQNTLEKYSEGGRKGAANLEKRSKNEVYFCELCEKYFNNVEHNVPLFNGWDADIIIHDVKIAVLWNGIWHYKEMQFKNTKTSLAQIQNRDNIKIKEITDFGYTPYIIKDLNGYDKEFVEKEFNIFINFIKAAQ